MKTLLSIVVAECAVLALIFWAEIVGPGAPSQFLIRNITFNSASANPTVATPKEFAANLRGVVGLDIRLSVNVHDDHYDNIFQTADGRNAIRLELTHPRTLNLALADTHYFKATENFALNQWHEVRLTATKGEIVELVLDGEKLLSIRDPGLTALRYDFGLVAVGTGYSRQRALQGEIREFTLAVDHVVRGSALDVIALVLSVGLSLVALRHLLRDGQAQRRYSPSRAIHAGFAVLGTVVVALTSGWLLGTVEPRFANWYPLLFAVLALPLAQTLLRYDDLAARPPGSVVAGAFGLVGGAALAYLLYATGSGARSQLSAAALLLILYSTLATVGLCLAATDAENIRTRMARGLALVAVSLAMWAALMELRNWRGMAESLIEHPSVTVLAAVLALAISWQFILSGDGRLPQPTSRATRPRKALALAEGFLVYGTFALLSFRFDTLFVPGSDMHWEYYVGAIRGLRDGSWLLWDTPSQYGFLNTLMPAMLPAPNSWQALYVFQGGLLLIASSLAYRAIVILAPGSKLFAFLLVVAGVFFADPDLIGPALYPSSSVMRFFWCYVLLFVLSRFVAKSGASVRRDFMLPGLGAWLAGVLWSFESAVYCTAIYFLALAAAGLLPAAAGGVHRIGIAEFLKTLAARCLLAAGCLGGMLAAAWAHYQLKLGNAPDWGMYFEHAFGYAGGFGAMPVSPHGAGWVFVLAFVAIASTIYRGSLQTGGEPRAVVWQAGALGCILAISSYFVGRATPSNVTAVLPIIALTLAVSLKAGHSGEGPSRGWLAVTAAPVFVVLFTMSLGAPNFPQTLRRIETLTGRIEQRLRAPEPPLKELLAKAGITPADRVVYYGFAAAMPAYEDPQDGQRVYDKSWLPNPLQLLEEPIAPERRRIVISRFVERLPESGFFLQAKGQHEERAREWISIIGATHRMEQVYENRDYRIIRFRKI